ncbi:hypothetical protein [Microbulbifer sp. VAAF005]|uniref:hypothetical protein n=1 Tax=Microbulbifer sp. VAAF005 TaxID=3034230 RepID=UPI0024AE7E47|nr:hypothetical protein [Microbulbifer sp. VAAF005]WHI48966.1 hypothetical protein P0078_11620 [Microbulbifer sp. VAAF005]
MMREEGKTKSGHIIILSELRTWKPEHPKYGISYASTGVLEGNNKKRIRCEFVALKKSTASHIDEIREIAKSAY